MIIVSNNECEDKNNEPGDGCSKDCKIEKGWECIGLPSTCKTVCGDGIIAGKEECDDGNDENDDICTNKCKINKKSSEYITNKTIGGLTTSTNIL